MPKRKTCALCKAMADSALSSPFESLLSLKDIPLSDDYSKSPSWERYPLSLVRCVKCQHVQLGWIVEPDILFKDYLYETSSSTGLVKHFEEYADWADSEFDLSHLGVDDGSESLVVDVGSNDGTLLKFFQDMGLNVVGVDASVNISGIAAARGIPTIPEFFNIDVANNIVAHQGHAALITANNSFAHSETLVPIVEGVAELLETGGHFVFEVSYLMDMLNGLVFDFIYHEHQSYHSIGPLIPFFETFGLSLIDVERVGTKCGSVRVTVVKEQNAPPSPNVGSFLEEEAEIDEHTFEEFSKRIETQKERTLALLGDSEIICGYGASAPATTLIYHFGLEERLVRIIDDNEQRQGLFSPGCGLRVESSDYIYEENVDTVVILAWPYADTILERHNSWEGKFVIPLPEARELVQ